MSEKYQPEIGQACFGQPYQEYEVPLVWDAALEYLDQVLCRVQGNTNQESYSSPFRNTGNTYECPVFTIHAYDWNDENEQEYNFKWKDVKISWYKYLGRGMSANMDLRPELAQQMLEECCRYLDKQDEKNFDLD